MLIWTAPSEGAGTSHRRHPGGDGDSVFTSRTSSPMKAYAGQARDISWECRVWSGGQQEGLQKRGDCVHLAGRVCREQGGLGVDRRRWRGGFYLGLDICGGQETQELTIGAGETLRGRENLLLCQGAIPRVHVVAINSR